MAEWLNNRFLGGWNAHKKLGEAGWMLLMIGIFIEIADAGFAANDGWQTRQIAAKNNPLMQPASQVSATLLLTVDATTYTPHPEQSMANTFFNFGSGSITNMGDVSSFRIRRFRRQIFFA